MRRVALLAVTGVGLLVWLAAPAQAGSVERVNYRADAPNGPRLFFDNGGLELTGSCTEGEPDDVDIQAETTVADTSIHVNQQFATTQSVAQVIEDDFQPGAPVMCSVTPTRMTTPSGN